MSATAVVGAVVLALSAVSTPSAMAQDDAINDPDSPAGEEYSVPLDRARRDHGDRSGAGLGPGGGGSSGGGSSGPSANPGSSGGSGAPGRDLFGAGISRADSKHGGPGERERGGGSPAGLRSAVPPAFTASAQPSGSNWPIAGLTLLVIAAGTLLGVVVRRKQTLGRAGS